MTKNEPHPKQLFTILFFLSVLFLPVANALAPESPPEQLDVYFKAVSPISTIKPAVMASVASGDDLFEGLTFRTLIKCLAYYESGYQTNVYGDFGKAYGVLQFWQETFNKYCDGSYYDPRAQVVCCDKMLIEDWNNRFHWSTIGYCLTN